MPILRTEFQKARSAINDQYARKATRTYLVQATTDLDENLVRTGLPFSIYSLHPTDSRQVLLDISVDLVSTSIAYYDNPADRTDPYQGSQVYVWTATLEYGPWNPLEHTTTGDPTNQPLRPRFTSTNTPQIVYEDVDGNPVVNSAGDYFDPPIERDFPRWTLTVVRNEASPTMATIGPYANRINEAAWNGFPPKTVKLSPIQLPAPEFSQFTGNLYYPIEYVFEINFDGWTKNVLNQGYRELSSTGKLIPILVGGTPASSPVMLDRNGHALITPGYLDSSGGLAPDEPAGTTDYIDGTGTGTGTATTVVVNAYEIYRPLDFTLLDNGIPAMTSQRLDYLSF
jgi:hypothetical protein